MPSRKDGIPLVGWLASITNPPSIVLVEPRYVAHYDGCVADFSGSRAWVTPLLFSIPPLSNITPILGDNDSTAAAVNSRGSSMMTTASRHPLPPWLSIVSGIETAVVFSSAGLSTSHLATDIAVAMKGRHFFSGTS